MSTLPATTAPVVLELADLPRDQLGPFVILGLDKTATTEEIEAAWAQRLVWARKGLIKTPLEDINWAREVLQDSARRLGADAASLNLDTSDGLLRQLSRRFAGLAKHESACRPLDRELPLADYTPDIPVPDPREEACKISIGKVPLEFPAVKALLEELTRKPLDPWSSEVDFPDH